ncbi:MAG: DNA-binding protein [Corynebacteriales bacterium]|nr:DNA-binding protein [Mycobacteriales bacterium]
MALDEDTVNKNRATQAELYGAPLGDLLGVVSRDLGLTQGRIARILGLSAPMLSQLASGQRVKIGNPVAVQRLQTLTGLAGQAQAGELSDSELDARLAEVSAQAAVLTQTSSTHFGDAGAVRAVQALLRAVSSSEELVEASAALATSHPHIAEVLRVYGAAPTDEALAHYQRLTRINAQS